MSDYLPEVIPAGDMLSGKLDLRSFHPPVGLAVVGDPVSHSKSPFFHNAALRSCGLEMQYARVHARPELFAETVAALARQGCRGLNVTIPHKAAALDFVDEADDFARRSGSVNTILFEDGRTIGRNTDGPGFAAAVLEEFGAAIAELRIMVLGAGGGAGRAIAVHCAMQGCQQLVLVNRTMEKSKAIADDLDSFFSQRHGTGVKSVPWDTAALAAECANVDLVVNASSIGMRPGDPPALSVDAMRRGLMVYDTVYAGGDTPLVVAARGAGAKAANGLAMLLHQGALSFECWFHRIAPLDVMRRALLSNT